MPASKPKKLGRRLQDILLAEREENIPLFTSRIRTLREAESQGLVEIHQQRDHLNLYYYSLTKKGEELRDSIKSSTTPVIVNHDPKLHSLLNRVALANELYEKAEESGNEVQVNFDFNALLNDLIELVRLWIDYACTRLNIDINQTKFDVYPCEPEFENMLASVDIQTHGQPIKILFAVNDRPPFRWPLLSIEMDCRDHSRLFFKQALLDYPRLLSDILESAGAIRFEDYVGNYDTPPARARATNWMKAYFTKDDPEHHFQLTVTFNALTTKQTIRKAIAALIALYDSASAALNFEQDPDRLINHHQVIFAKAKPKNKHR